jgi:hypothetical protein
MPSLKNEQENPQEVENGFDPERAPQMCGHCSIAFLLAGLFGAGAQMSLSA